MNIKFCYHGLKVAGVCLSSEIAAQVNNMAHGPFVLSSILKFVTNSTCKLYNVLLRLNYSDFDKDEYRSCSFWKLKIAILNLFQYEKNWIYLWYDFPAGFHFVSTLSFWASMPNEPFYSETVSNRWSSWPGYGIQLNT